MASSLKNLSDFSTTEVPSAKGLRFGIVTSEWNEQITGALYKGAVQTLLHYGAAESGIQAISVPGSYELTAGAQFLAAKADIDVVICLGCVIQGETPHFDFICSAVAHGLTHVGIQYNKTIVFGVLTTNTLQQAIDRSGGKHGNKGDEAAVTGIKMARLLRS